MRQNEAQSLSALGFSQEYAGLPIAHLVTDLIRLKKAMTYRSDRMTRSGGIEASGGQALGLMGKGQYE